jgi:hypothetical protein
VSVQRLSRVGLAWRAGALLAGTLLVTYGTARGTDDLWPFAPMSQFAFGVDLDGQIRSTYVEALTTEGERVRVPLSPRGVGVGRAEVEGQLPSIVADPSKLGALAVAQARLHPDEPQYVHLWLRQEVVQLRDGRDAGRSDELLAEWAVRDGGR